MCDCITVSMGGDEKNRKNFKLTIDFVCTLWYYILVKRKEQATSRKAEKKVR